jgi:lysophospholipase L1-like esterase
MSESRTQKMSLLRGSIEEIPGFLDLPTTEPVAINKLWWNAGVLSKSVGIPPSITSQPSNTTVNANGAASFSVTATNATSYQWQKYVSSVWTNISAATSSSYTTPALAYPAENGGQYRCVVTGTGGTTNSNAATVTVQPPGANPVENFTVRNGPVSMVSGSNLSTASSFFANNTIPVASTLSRVEIQAGATASVKLKLAVPRSAGGWTITDLQTLSVTSGANVFTVAGSTLSAHAIPAGGIVGLYSATTGALKYSDESSVVISEGYTAFTGDVSGTVTATPSGQTYQHQMQFAWEATANRSGLPTYIFQETFDGSTLPARHLNSATPWTFSTGVAVPGAATHFLRQFFTTNGDRRTVEVDFQFTDSATTFALGTFPVISGASTDNGSLIGVDVSANTLIHYNPYTSAIPSVRSTDTITGFTLNTGVNYRLKLVKSGKTMTATIRNLDTSAEFSISKDNDVSYVVGYGFGAASIGTATGTGVSVTAWRAYFTQTNPSLAIYGDSITEGSGTTDDLCFAQRLLDAIGGQGMYSGDGGTTTVSAYRRWLFDSLNVLPKYVCILSGANNANSDAERDLFQPDMIRFIDRVIAAGSTPIVCYITPNSDSAKQTRINVMNGQLTTILSTRPTAIAVRTDQTLSVGGDGVTYNAAWMADGVHPNATGHQRIADAIIAAAPGAFD